jgi:hypothetical protein
MRSHAASQALTTWRTWLIGEIKVQRGIAHCRRRWLAKHGAKELVGAFMMWGEKAEEEREFVKRRKENLRTMRLLLKERRLAQGWRTLVGFYESRVGLKRAVGYIRHRELAGVWTKWVESLCEQTIEDEALGEALVVWRHNQLAVGYRGLVAALERNADMMDVMREAMGAWQKSQLHAAFNKWYEHVAESKKERDAVRKSVAHFIRFSTSRAFRTWREGVDSLTRKRDLSGKAYKHWNNRLMLTAWRRWRQACEDDNVVKAQIKAVMEHWTQGLLSKAFETWRWLTETQGSHQTAMMSAGKLWRSGLLGKAFYTWLGMAESKRRVWYTYRRGNLSRGFRAWRESCVSFKHQLANLNRALLTWRQGLLAKAFYTWLDTAADSRHTFFLFHRAAVRLQNVKICQAWNKLRETTQNERPRLPSAGRKEKKSDRWKHGSDLIRCATPDQMVLTTALRHFQKHLLATAFVKWDEDTCVGREELRVSHRGASFFRGGWIPQSFWKWREEAASQRWQEYILHKEVLRWTNRQLSMAFGKWRFEIDQAVHQVVGMNHAITQFRLMSLSRAFCRLRDMIADQYGSMDKIRYGTNFFRLRVVNRAWRQWQLLLQQGQEGNVHYTQAVMHWKNKELSAWSNCFLRWRQHAVEYRRQFFIMHKTVQVYNHRQISTALLYLSEYEYHKRNRGSLQVTITTDSKEWRAVPEVLDTDSEMLPYMAWSEPSRRRDRSPFQPRPDPSAVTAEIAKRRQRGMDKVEEMRRELAREAKLGIIDEVQEREQDEALRRELDLRRQKDALEKEKLRVLSMLAKDDDSSYQAPLVESLPMMRSSPTGMHQETRSMLEQATTEATLLPCVA